MEHSINHTSGRVFDVDNKPRTRAFARNVVRQKPTTLGPSIEPRGVCMSTSGYSFAPRESESTAHENRARYSRNGARTEGGRRICARKRTEARNKSQAGQCSLLITRKLRTRGEDAVERPSVSEDDECVGSGAAGKTADEDALCGAIFNGGPGEGHPRHITRTESICRIGGSTRIRQTE
jgi:hypothetical protein